MAEKIKLFVINTLKDGMFIKEENTNPYSSSGFTNIPKYLFDGKKLEQTFKPAWFKIDSIPTRVEQKNPDTRANERYALKKGFPVSNLTPAIIAKNDFDYDSDITGLYVLEFDVVEGEMTELEFEIEVLDEITSFQVDVPKFKSTPMLIDELTCHPDFLYSKPRKISSIDLYKLVREHIKKNIDRRYANITSDYDFCLTVDKVIREGLVKQRANPIYRTSPGGYSNYPTIEPIFGDNQSDLEEKVQKYLDDTLYMINKPYISCECCEGHGVVLEK